MSQDKPYSPFPDLLAELKQLCLGRHTGTLFIATDDNRLARITLDHGNIVFLSFQNKRGTEALSLLNSIRAGRSRFEDGILTSVSKTPLPSTQEMLQYLGGGMDAGAAEVSTAAPVPAASGKAPASNVRLTPAVVTLLEEELAEHIGPLAGIVCAEHLAQHDSFETVVTALAAEIPDQEHARTFNEQVRRKAQALMT